MRHVVGHLLDAHTDPAAMGGTELAQLPDHVLGQIGRYGKADTDRAAGGRKDGGVHTDHRAVHVEQRSAGIAAIDRRVGLNEIVIRSGIDIAVARRNDARRHGGAEAERIADRHHPVAYPCLVRIAEFRGRQRLRRLHLEKRQIGLVVAPDQLGRKRGAVIQRHRDLVGAFDHMIVGHDQAGGIDDEAGAERGDMPRQPAIVLQEILEQVLQRRTRRHIRQRKLRFLRLQGLGGGDVHHRRQKLAGQIGKGIRCRPCLGRGARGKRQKRCEKHTQDTIRHSDHGNIHQRNLSGSRPVPSPQMAPIRRVSISEHSRLQTGRADHFRASGPAARARRYLRLSPPAPK